MRCCDEAPCTGYFLAVWNKNFASENASIRGTWLSKKSETLKRIKTTAGAGSVIMKGPATLVYRRASNIQGRRQQATPQFPSKSKLQRVPLVPLNLTDVSRRYSQVRHSPTALRRLARRDEQEDYASPQIDFPFKRRGVKKNQVYPCVEVGCGHLRCLCFLVF